VTGKRTITKLALAYVKENPEVTAYEIATHLNEEHHANTTSVSIAKLLLLEPTIRVIPVKTDYGPFINLYWVVPTLKDVLEAN